MKIREVRAVIEQVAASHRRLASAESAAALIEFSEAIKPWDDKTVAAFVKLAEGGAQSYTKR
jgi:hypothetical protein